MPALIFATLFIKKKCEAKSWLRTRPIINKKTSISVANATLHHPRSKLGLYKLTLYITSS